MNEEQNPVTDAAAEIVSLAPFVPAGPSLDEALNFYENKLGFTRVKRGAAELILQQLDDRHFADNFMYSVKVRNIEALHEEYEKAGYYALDRDEPPHVHVKWDRLEAKFWMDPLVEREWNGGFAAHELNNIRILVEQHREFLLERWHEFFHQ